MRRIAVSMTGVMASSILLVLLIIPAIHAIVEGWQLRHAKARAFTGQQAAIPTGETGASPSRAADQEGSKMEFFNMARTNKIKGAIAMMGLVGGLVLAGVPAFAQTPTPATPQAAPEHGMMMQGTPSGQAGMPMNPEMM